MEVIISRKSGNCQEERNVAKEVERISKQVELMIVIGNKNMLAEDEIYKIAQQECMNVIFIETIEDVYTNYIKRFKKVGILAEETASNQLVEQVIAIVENLETDGYMYENSR